MSQYDCLESAVSSSRNLLQTSLVRKLAKAVSPSWEEIKALNPSRVIPLVGKSSNNGVYQNKTGDQMITEKKKKKKKKKK